MVCGTTERAAVVWCILNRADDARDATPAGVIAVVTKPYQFHGYAADHPLLPELEELALLKIARIATGHGKSDNWVDLAGYAACGGELQSRPAVCGK